MRRVYLFMRIYNIIPQFRFSVIHFCMNWPALSFDWNHLKAFVAAVEEGSLSAAAKALGQSQPTVSRQIAALEREFGTSLLERTTRSQTLTEAGKALLQHALMMRDAAARLSLTAAGLDDDLRGQITITASDGVCVHYLPPILKTIHERAPKLSIELVADNKIRALQLREADIAIRHVRPDEPDLFAQLIREFSVGLYAAPSYIEDHGKPEKLDDLNAALFASLNKPEGLAKRLQQMGAPVSPDQFIYQTGSILAQWEMIRSGLAIGFMPTDVAEASPGLTRLCPDTISLEVPFWAVAHTELKSNPRVRLVFDSLVEGLKHP